MCSHLKTQAIASTLCAALGFQASMSKWSKEDAVQRLLHSSSTWESDSWPGDIIAYDSELMSTDQCIETVIQLLVDDGTDSYTRKGAVKFLEAVPAISLARVSSEHLCAALIKLDLEDHSGYPSPYRHLLLRLFHIAAKWELRAWSTNLLPAGVTPLDLFLHFAASERTANEPVTEALIAAIFLWVHSLSEL